MAVVIFNISKIIGAQVFPQKDTPRTFPGRQEETTSKRREGTHNSGCTEGEKFINFIA
jgi:hypothetical protein